MDSAVTTHLLAQRDRHVAELSEWLAIPSISALPEHKPQVRRAADWAAARMRKIGLAGVELIETPGHPIVYGEWLGAPGAPTILFYGHYDVQPVDPLHLWTTPPFTPTVRDGAIHARGASDDKGQVYMHLAAIEACMKVTGRLPVNIKCVVEGEEEVGSVHLDAFIEAHKKRLAADVVVISDTAMFERGIPSLCYGLRGLAFVQLDVTGSSTDLHSGAFGGALENPAFALARILAAMKDASGRVAIPGFYDDVRPLTPAERAEYRKLPFDEAAFAASIHAPGLTGEAGYTVLERLSARPTFEINGLGSGFQGEGAKTVLPARAMAKVSMRLVPDQRPEQVMDALEAYIKKIAPPTVTVTVTRMHGGLPWKASLDNPYVAAAARAIAAGFGKPPVYTREGGSIPVVATFERILGLPSVLFGVGLPDDRIHAPDEKLDLGNFHAGVAATAALYGEIAQVRR